MKLATKPLFRTLRTASLIVTAALVVPHAALSHEGGSHAGHAAHSDGYKRLLKTYAVPDVALTDSDSRSVRLRDLLSAKEPVMLNFIFTTCGTICPPMSQVFSEVPAALGGTAPSLRMISISIDPLNDTPAKLKAYAGKFGSPARWTFLTGRLQDIETVQRAFDGYRGDKMNHEPFTLIRRAPGTSWIRIEGFASAAVLAREVSAPAGK